MASKDSSAETHGLSEEEQKHALDLPEQSHKLPPPPDTGRQFPHFLFRALLAITLMIDGFIVLAVLVYATLAFTVTGPAGGFPLSVTVLLFGIILPAGVITALVYAGYKATELKTPYK